MSVGLGSPSASRLIRDAAWRHTCCFMLFPPIHEKPGPNGGAMTIEERAIGSVVGPRCERTARPRRRRPALERPCRLTLRKGESPRPTERKQTVLCGQQRLGVIVASFLAARSVGGALRLVNPSSRLHQLLAMARLLTVVDVCKSDEEAVESFGVPT